MASTSKIPSSQTKVASLCCCRVSPFIPVVVMQRYDYNPDLKIVVKKLYVVFLLKTIGQLQ
jgi:hypothetical protein